LAMANKRTRKVFIWNAYKNWRRVVLSILADHLDASVFKRLREHPPRYISSDDTSWLDSAVEAVKDYRPDTKGLLADELPRRYSYVRAFHGCRPTSLDSYHTKGLLPCNPEELKLIAREIFKNQGGVEKAISELEKDDYTYEDHNRGKLFFCLTEEELVDFCGHYLLQGSEYLAGIAARIHETPVLRARGKATVFACDVPICDMDEETILSLAGEMLEQIGDAALKRPLGSAGNSFGFSIRVPLNPEFIVSTTHPTGIPNPHRCMLKED
jgi:hypothetical protein